MRTSVASLSKKFISTFFAATLALGLVPAAAFAVEDEPTEEETSANVISSEVSEADEVEKSALIEQNEAEGLTTFSGEPEAVDEEAGSEDAAVIPAAMERISEDVALTQPIAQQESTRSYFLAQTLESTKTVPIVSANLPLDKGTSSDVVEPDAEGEGSPTAEDEGGEDSDESDLPTSNIIAADSTVIGSFEYQGIVYAVEEGGESVAAIAVDYRKLPSESIDKRTLVVLPTVSVSNAYGIDFFSVTRIADYAFASLSIYAISNALSVGAEHDPRDGGEGAEFDDQISGGPNENASVGITMLGIPASVTTIDDNAFTDFDTLQYIVVQEGNPSYAIYDGALYSADLTNLRLIPEGRVGTVRVAPSATTVDPEAFSHCPSVDTVVADPASDIWRQLQESDLRNGNGDAIELIDFDAADERALSRVYVPDAYVIEAFQNDAFELAVASAETNEASKGNLSDSMLTSRNASFVTVESKDISNTRLRLRAVADNDKIYYFLNGTITSGKMRTLGYRATSGDPKLVYALSVTTFKPASGYTADECLAQFDKACGGTVSAIVCQYCHACFDRHLIEEIGNGVSTSAHAMRFLVDRSCLTDWTENLISNTGTGPSAGTPSEHYVGYWSDYAQGYVDSNEGLFDDGEPFRYIWASGKGDKWTTFAGEDFPTLNNVSRLGYVCTGFTKNSNGTGGTLSKSDTPSKGAYHYYAQWTPIQYDLVFDKNDAPSTAGSIDPIKGIKYDSTVTLPAGTSLTWPGHHFVEWNTRSDGKGETYQGSTGYSNFRATPGEKKLYAIWADNPTYDITYEMHGHGTKPTSPTSYTQGVGATLPTSVTQTGWVFDGWYKESSYTNKVTSISTSDSGAITVHAKWTRTDIYTITLNSQLWASSSAYTKTCDATSVGTQYLYYWVDKGWFTSSNPGDSDTGATTAAALITKPTLNGYDFKGYRTGKAGSGTQTMSDAGKLISTSAPTVSNKAATWYAEWEIRSVYAITLNSQLWPSSSANQATCNATSTGTGTIYYWVGVGYFTSSKSYGATPTGAANTTSALIETPTLTGYGFGGYWTTKTGPSTSTRKITDAGIISSTSAPSVDSNGKAIWYAKWTKTSVYTITLNSQLWASKNDTTKVCDAPNAGTTAIYYWVDKGWYNTSSPAVSDTAASTDKALVTKPTLSGYDFEGYYTGKAGDGDRKIDADGKLLSINSISQDGTWYAKWTIKSVYSLTLNSQLWASSSAGTPVCNATPAGTGTLYYWEGVGWFNDSKSQGAAPTGAASTSTDLITNLPSLTGYAFEGYYDGKNGSGNPKTSGKKLSSVAAISENTTWYAKWTINSVHTVALNSQLWPSSTAGTPVCKATEAGTTALYYWEGVGWFAEKKSQGAEPAGAAKTTDELVTPPSLNGYTFGGYFTGKDGSGSSKTDDKMLKSIDPIKTGTTWYAKWSIKPVYTVTLNSQLWDSASASEAKSNATTPGTAAIYYWDGVGWFNASKAQGAAPTGAASASNALITPPTLTGYTYGGYYTGKVGNGTKRIEGAKLSTTDAINASTTWYVDWTINSYKVYWAYDGAQGKTDFDRIYSYGSTFTTELAGSKPGYKFTGWQATGADTALYTEGYTYTMPDGEVWFKATWSAHPYTKVNLSDPYLNEPSAQGAIWHWPEQGYVKSETSKEVKTDGIVTPPNLTRLGYDFLGWYDVEAQNENSDVHKMIDANGNMVKSGAPSANTEGGTVVWYAHWSRPACPVNLVASYAASEDEDPFEVLDTDYLTSISRAVYGKGFDESIEAGRIAEDKLPLRTGYTFKGYYTKKNPEVYKGGAFDGTQWIASDGTLSPNNWNEPAEKKMPVTLYAAWEIDQCEVTFDVTSNVKNNTEMVSVVSEGALDGTIWYYGKPKGEMPKVTESTIFRTGYTFGGWYYLKDTNGGDVESNRRFVSDAQSDPIDPVNWDVEKRDKVTLYPYWTAKSYTLVFDDNFPKIEGLETQGEASGDKTVTVVYDAVLDLSAFDPEFDPYTFKGWYTATDQLFEGTHMTDNGDDTKRFTPRGSLASQSEIELHALWSEPGKYQYTLLWKAPGANEITESVHDYYFSDTIKFNGTEAPTTTAAGWRFEGWVEMDSYKSAHDALSGDEPYKQGDTTDGWKPISKWDRFFVAKWSEKPFSVSFSTAYTDANEEGVSWLMATDLLENWKDNDGNEGSDLSWTEACKRASQTGSEMSTGIVYDIHMPAFTLPDVKRKGQVFEGWKLLDENGEPSHDAPARGIVIDPSTQDAYGMRDLVYVPVFKDAYYSIVLDANGFGEEQRFEGEDAIPYSGEFTFPYPSTLSTGSVFDCWAADTNSVSDGTFKAYPDTDPVKIAPVYNEMGEMVEFGLAQLADEHNVITLYAVWNNANYHVDVPLFANLAIDTERGDVIAGINTIAPSKDNEDKTATYRVESIRYEPLKNGQGEDAKYAFERPGTPTDKIYLTVYAGLSLGENSDIEHLLYADNVSEGGVLRYTDAYDNERTAKPLLIELGGKSTALYTRTAPAGRTSLADVTDEDVPNGFLTFDIDNPLTVRYGLYFENPQTRKDFAFGSTKYDWLLPRNDGANKNESTIASDPNYGRRNAWSGSTVDIAKLHYTLSLVSETK